MSNALFGCHHPFPCSQSALITHSPRLFSQRLSLTPVSVTFAQVCLWWTSLYNMWHESLPPVGSLLSAQGHQVNQISFHCLQSLYWCSFLSFSSWLNIRVANVLPLDIFFFSAFSTTTGSSSTVIQLWSLYMTLNTCLSQTIHWHYSLAIAWLMNSSIKAVDIFFNLIFLL